MSRARWMYWPLRWLCAAPVTALLAVSVLLVMLFDAVWGVPDGHARVDAGDMRRDVDMLFTAKRMSPWRP